MNVNIAAKIQKVFDDRYYEVWDLGKTYTLLLAEDVLEKASIVELLRNKPMSTRQLLKKLDFAEQSLPALTWMLNFLSENDILSRNNDGGDFYYSWKEGKKHSSLDQISNAILSTDASWEVFIKFMSLVAGAYPAFFKGQRRGLDIIFLKEGKTYWNEYFGNKFQGYSVFNILGACVVCESIKSYKKASLLELGGGTGGATEKLVEIMRSYGVLKNLERYVFSDISPLFLRNGNKILLNGLRDEIAYELKKVDFNYSFLEQEIERDSLDIVYGVNALHVAKNLLETLKNIYSVLKVNGSLIICEHIRPDRNSPLYMELFFNLLETYTNVETDPTYRPSHGFLAINDWLDILQMVGFKRVEIIDDSYGREKFTRDKIAMVIRGVK